MKKVRTSNMSFVQRLTLAPYSVWAAFFILVPLFFVAYYAFTDSDFNFTFENIKNTKNINC